VVFIPLSDDNPLRSIRFQWVTVTLIAANVAAFIWQNAPFGQTAAASFSFIPSELLQVGIFGGSAHGPDDGMDVAEVYTLLSYMFLHGDILHLASNMLFLWVFGDNVEDAMGHFRFLAFYLMCGVCGALAHAVAMPASKLPLIGASGAVAGVIAAYLMLHPRVMVWVLAFRFIPLKISAAWVLGVWVATQLLMVLLNQADQIAWWAHIGGMAAGAVLILFMRRPDVPLFDRGLPPVQQRL
jgi:membrane associated rhomboid family serine protease